MGFSQWVELLATVISIPGAIAATVVILEAVKKRKGKEQ
jgi:hypothetical protein